MKPLVLFGVSLLLQSCTVMYFTVENKLTTPSPESQKNGAVTYWVSVAGNPVQRTRKPQYTSERLEQMRAEYSRSAQKVFDREKIAAVCTTNKEEASFFINIKSTPFRSALPQEYLTGLSFGLIPSWGTRYDEYTYTFERIGKKKPHSYYVNAKSYNHLFLFPIFWVDFFTCDESRVYEKALRNYLTKE